MKLLCEKKNIQTQAMRIHTRVQYIVHTQFTKARSMAKYRAFYCVYSSQADYGI